MPRQSGFTNQRKGRLSVPSGAALRSATLGFAAALLVAIPPGTGNAQTASADTSPSSAQLRAQPERVSRSELIERGIRLNFEGRLEEALDVWQQMRGLGPEDPAPPVLETSTWYWFDNFDPENPELEAKVIANSEEAIEKAQAKLDRNERDAEAHYWMGSALMNLGRMYGSSGRFVKAGTMGERGRKHLERVAELDPQMHDARYSLGLYYFYASLVPNFVKWLTFLWFVPTGDADKGIAYLREVEAQGHLHRDDAALVLVNINTYHRDDHALARALGEKLRATYPGNTVIEFEMIELAMAEKDYDRALQLSRAMLEREPANARDSGRHEVARIWGARAELMSGRPDRALATLERYGDGEPADPSWAARWVNVTRGQAFDVLGRRETALAEYQTVIDLELSPLWSRATELATAGQERPFALPSSVTLSRE